MIALVLTGLLFLLLSAFFSGMEMAFISSSKLKIELAKNQGKKSGLILSHFVKKPSHFIGTYLIGNNISLVIYGLVLSALLSTVWQNYLPGFGSAGILLLETLIGTLIILLLGEFLPKLIFRLEADKLLHGLSIPFSFFYALLFFPVLVVNGLTKFLMRTFFGIDMEEGSTIFTEVDLENYLKQNVHAGHKSEEEVDAELLGNALDLREIRVRQCLIPRPEIAAIDVSKSITTLRETFIETNYSKILVYKESLDNVLGYVHHFDLHKNPSTIGNIVKPIPVVPESMMAQTLLTEFKREGKSMALVVDEYGGTAGIVTLEDILEEIFGEIKDEHDDDAFIEEQLAMNEFLFSGRLEIDHINDTYNLDIPEGDYETLSGYLISKTEDIPERGEKLVLGHLEFVIFNVSNTKIETVKVIRR